MTLVPRTDLIDERKPDPLSEEAVDAMFVEIRRSLGLPPASISSRSTRRKELEEQGFPFATDEDMVAI